MNVPALCISVAVSAVATVDDVMTRRVHNVLLGIMAVISIVLILYFYGAAGLQNSVLGFLAGAALYLPLAWMGVVGGGDLKLLAVVGLSSGPWATLIIGFVALGWASVLGILQVIFQGQLKGLAQNMMALAKFQKPEAKQLHKIPFAAAILLATLTQWGLSEHGKILGKIWGGFL